MGRFKPGTEIICVDNKPRTYDSCDLVLNKVYTVKYTTEPRSGVVLFEQRSTNNSIGDYWIDRFEPLVTDAVLEKELESVPEPYTV